MMDEPEKMEAAPDRSASVMLQGGFDLIHEDKNVLSSNVAAG